MPHEHAAADEYCGTDEVTLRSITVADLAEVSRLGISSKASWGYSREVMQVFAKELTLKEWALDQLSDAQVALQNGQILGYFTIRKHSGDMIELEHLFVHPNHFGHGVGRVLLEAALASAASVGGEKLIVIADPNSAEFYERFGAACIGEHQSSIAGRVIPVFEFILDQSR